MRILPSNRGRDLSAFFIACRDVLKDGRYDLVVKIHSKKTVAGWRGGRVLQAPAARECSGHPGLRGERRRALPEGGGPGPGVPPMIHIGYPTMGRGWFANNAPAQELPKELGIRVPFDEISPLAPYGGMWIARPEALKILAGEHGSTRSTPRPTPRRRQPRPRAGTVHRVRGGRARVPHPHDLHRRVHRDQPHVARVQARPDGRHDARLPDRSGPSSSTAGCRSRRHRRAHSVYLKLNHPRVAAALWPLEAGAHDARVAVAARHRGAKRTARRWKVTSLKASFDPRSNSIGFLRWLMAFMVIFSHAGPLGGFYGGQDLGTQWSTEQSLGGVAVAGFFFLSGFLITKSKMGRSSTPASSGGASCASSRRSGSSPRDRLRARADRVDARGRHDQRLWNATVESPFTYFSNNMWLPLTAQHRRHGHQHPVLRDHGGFDWNGSAWTLAFEFGATSSSPSSA